MKKTILLAVVSSTCFTLSAASADNTCYRLCALWDTFCKSPQQIVATKCRLGVPVMHEQCRRLGVPSRYLVRGGGSLVDALPCTVAEEKKQDAMSLGI